MMQHKSQDNRNARQDTLHTGKHALGNLPIGLTITVGLAVSALTCAVVWNQDQRTLQAVFTAAAENRMSALKRAIEIDLHELESLGSLFARSGEVERDEFRLSVQPLLAHDPAVQAFEWIPRVRHSRRAEYEQTARRDGFPDFQITDREAQGRMVRAAPRQEYFPVYYVEPYEGNETALGYDLGVDPSRLEALEYSCDTGQMVATGRITLVQETAGQYGFVIFLPIYRQGAATDSVEDRRENLQGFVLRVWRIGAMVEKALTYLEPEGLDIHVYDKSASAGQRFLYFHSSRKRTAPGEPITEDEGALRMRPRHAANMDLAGRTWSILCTPTPDYVAAHRSWQPWGVLATGLLLTGLLGLYLVMSRARTASVMAANLRLVREVTERKRSNERLNASEQEYRHLYDNAPDLYCSVRVDNARIRECNEALASASGYSKHEIVGRPIYDMYHPDCVEQAKESLESFIETGEIHGDEQQLRRKDGSKIDVSLNVSAVRDQNGKILYILFAWRDITERKLAEEQLNESEKRFRLAIADAPVPIMLHAEGGEIISINNAWTEITGYVHEEIPSIAEWTRLAYGTQQKAMKATIDKLYERDAKVDEGEYSITTRRGDTVVWDFCSAPVGQLPDGRRLVMSAAMDVTERKHAEEEARVTHEKTERMNVELAQQAKELHAARRASLNLIEDLEHTRAAAEAANRAKSEFLANMSHEIRTPMTAILGFADNLLDSDQTESEKLNCIHTVRRNGENLLSIINDILDLSKIEAGKMAIEPRDSQPCRIVAEVASLMRARADAKGLPFKIEYIGAIPETIQSDPTRLRQILINLIGNAIKFTEVGAVRLVIRFVPGESKDPLCDGEDIQNHCPSVLQFDVVDTGRGMTPEQRAKLFQPFMQVDSSTTRKFGGTGLGLTISKRFAELLGGELTVTATEIGVGTTFRATVATGSLDGVRMLEDPMSATVVAGTADTIDQVDVSELRGLRILLAEDGPDNQRLISFVLKKAGADMTVKENGKLALDAALAARAEGKPFDVILMDMQMPVMDGYEATGRLRQQDYTGPIIALTAHAMEGDREKCMKAGCDDYATKPIDRRKLIALIVTRVSRRDAGMPSNENGSDELVSEPTDGDMLEPVETFVSELPERIAAIEKVIAQQDLAALATLARQLKGSAGGHGFPSIAEAAQELESSAKTAVESPTLARQVRALAELCGRARAGEPVA